MATRIKIQRSSELQRAALSVQASDAPGVNAAHAYDKQEATTS
jgi:hypothetical protein